ncbi:MAG: enolase C-terminal domain-like protein [Bacteroidota bacterium]
MKITLVHAYRVRIPFSFSIDHNLKKRACTESLILVLHSSEGHMGYGEATPREYVTGESSEQLWQLIQDLVKEWQSPEISSLEDIRSQSAAFAQKFPFPSLICAWETALLDVWGKHAKLPIQEMLGPQPIEEAQYSAVFPYLETTKLIKWLSKMSQLGMRQIKVKVGQEDDLAQLKEVRKQLDAEVDIRVDANRAWTYEEALTKLEILADLGVSCIEEPLKKEDIGRLAELVNTSPIPILLDESLASLEEAQHYAREIAADKILFNLKISKLGGLFKSSEIYHFARQKGISCQLGCHVGETAILSAAGRIFAQTHKLKYLEGSYAPFYMEDDISSTPLSFGKNGKADKLVGAGLGIEIDPQKLLTYHHA